MSASARVSSSLLAALALAGCVESEPHRHETTSLRVQVTSPTDLGSEAARLPDDVREAGVSVQALDEQGRLDTRLSAEVDVYVHTLGGLDGAAQKIALASGAGTGTVRLGRTFGPTYLWVEDFAGTRARPPTLATGTSPLLWFREPTIADISTPDTSVGTPASWLKVSPLEGKQVRVSGSQYGDAGRLVVTGVYADGYSISDVDCADVPCVAGPYGHVYVFSFSRPRDVRGRDVQVGQTMKWFEGGVAEFNGFTELNFPAQEIDDATPDLALLPDPTPLDEAWLADDAGALKMEQLEASLVSVADVTVCSLNSDWDKYKQWRVDIGAGCTKPVNVISASTVASFDPEANVGRKVARIVGTLKTVNLDGFNVWILLPRAPADITR